MGRRQNPQHPGFVGVDQRYDCRACIASHAERHEFPMLDAANQTAWAIFQRVEDQVRVGMDVVGLDYTILPTVFQLYDVPREDWRLTFEKIVEVNRAQQAERAIQRATEQSKQAAAKTEASFRG